MCCYVLQGVRERLQGLQDRLLCCMCLDGVVNTVLVPCGHASCRSCAAQIAECPQCRTQIQHRQKLFLPLSDSVRNDEDSEGEIWSPNQRPMDNALSQGNHDNSTSTSMDNALSNDNSMSLPMDNALSNDNSTSLSNDNTSSYNDATTHNALSQNNANSLSTSHLNSSLQMLQSNQIVRSSQRNINLQDISHNDNVPTLHNSEMDHSQVPVQGF